MKQYINENKIQKCNKCGNAITFVQNRFGKWYPVSVEFDDEGAPYIIANTGAHGNMTRWHECPDMMYFADSEPIEKTNGDVFVYGVNPQMIDSDGISDELRYNVAHVLRKSFGLHIEMVEANISSYSEYCDFITEKVCAGEL